MRRGASPCAPPSFGLFGGALLVGNFGDGAINAYDPKTGSYMGALRDANGMALHLDGLWGIAFGNGVASQPTNALFYAAGPNGEKDGVYGMIRAVDSPLDRTLRWIPTAPACAAT